MTTPNEVTAMTWFNWHWWRFAHSRWPGMHPTFVWDGFGTWKPIGFGFYWLVSREAPEPIDAEPPPRLWRKDSGLG